MSYSFDATTQVATLSLNDGKMNAFGFEMIAVVNAGLDAAEADLAPHVGALLITSVGAKAFSAGFDLSVMGSKEMDDASVTARSELLQQGIDLCLRLFAFRRPLIIAASGHALALGGILLFTADLRIGADTPQNKIGLPEINLGMQLPMFGCKLAEARLNSPAALNSAVLLGQSYNPAEAVKAGFLDVVVPAEELGSYAAREAARLSEFCKGGFGPTKLHLRQGTIDFIRASGPAKL